MNLENPLLQGIQPTAGAPAGVLLAETDPSGQAGSRLTSIPGLITQAAGPPNGSTATVPPLYIDTNTGVLYWWDGAAWLRQEIVFPVDNVNSLTLLSTPINGALYQTKGYYVHEDGGANLYRYVGNSIQVCDGLFVLDGIGGDNTPGATSATYPGTGTGRFIAVDQSIADVQQAGAVGDGVTDDYFRLRAALDAGANRVTLHNLTYAFGTTLTLTGQFHLAGAGHRDTILLYTGTGTAIQIQDGLGTGTYDYVIEDLEVNASGADYAITYGVATGSPQSANGITRNVRVTGAAVAGYRLVASQGGRWYDCRADANAGDGLLSDDTLLNGSLNNKFFGCFFRNNRRGIYIKSGVNFVFHSPQLEINSQEGVYIEGQVDAAKTRKVFSFHDAYFENNNEGRGVGDFADFHVTSLGGLVQDVQVLNPHFTGVSTGNHYVRVDSGEVTILGIDPATHFYTANSTVARLSVRSGSSNPATAFSSLGANSVVHWERLPSNSNEPWQMWANVAGAMTQVAGAPSGVLTAYNGLSVPGGISNLNGSLTIADDAAAPVAVGSSDGFMLFSGDATNKRTSRGLVTWRTTNVSFCEGMVLGALGAVTTGILTGTTGADTFLTVSPHTDGNIYFENRTGSSITVNYVIFR